MAGATAEGGDDDCSDVVGDCDGGDCGRSDVGDGVGAVDGRGIAGIGGGVGSGGEADSACGDVSSSG